MKASLGSAHTILMIPSRMREDVREAFTNSFVQQMQVILGVSAAELCNTFND